MEDNQELLRTLPGDDVRQIMWRYSDRFDFQMFLQAVRGVARGPVARAVADGARNSHDWTPKKAELLKYFDESGITASFMDPSQGGFIEGPKNFLLALAAFELCWVDAGACTASLANNLALSPINERGTKEQRDRYMALCTPPKPGEDRQCWRGSFALTEPLPYVGVETGMVSGKIRVAEWKEGQEPVLQVEKRGRFITNIGYANFITAAVDTDDPRIKSSCMIIIEDTDPGSYDRGTPTKKMCHQLSSTGDPVISVQLPAHRIIGGYSVKDGVIVPKYSHSDVIGAVFHHTRVTVAVMSAAKLLSAVEPVIRYHRNRFRGAAKVEPGTPRYDLGIQGKEDALQRLLDVWAFGEAGASLGFATGRLFDELDPLSREKDAYFEKNAVTGVRAQMKAVAAWDQAAIALLPRGLDAVRQDRMAHYALTEAVANVMCPACKLWCTGWGATMMREAVSLVGGYGITEDCPGFLMNKWMDCQLEATYEGPEAVQRRQMSITMLNALFIEQFKLWTTEMKAVAQSHPDMGAGSVAGAMDAWLWLQEHLQNTKDANGAKLFQGNRQGVTFAMADLMAWILAARFFILDVLELEAKGPASPTLGDGLPGLLRFYKDMSAVFAGRMAGEVTRVGGELVLGYQTAPAAPEAWQKLRAGLDKSLAGVRLAKDRAGEALTRVMIPEALDYPL